MCLWCKALIIYIQHRSLWWEGGDSVPWNCAHVGHHGTSNIALHGEALKRCCCCCCCCCHATATVWMVVTAFLPHPSFCPQTEFKYLLSLQNNQIQNWMKFQLLAQKGRCTGVATLQWRWWLPWLLNPYLRTWQLRWTRTSMWMLRGGSAWPWRPQPCTA